MARYFPPQTVLLLHKFEAQEKPMHYETQRSWKKRGLIHRSPIFKETLNFLLLRESATFRVFSALCNLPSTEKFLFGFSFNF